MKQKTITYLTLWHGTDTDSCPKDCEIKKALKQYAENEISFKDLLTVADETDEGWPESFQNY